MGEISLLLEQPHSATVLAKTNLETLLLTRSRLDELRREDPELSLKLFEILAYTLSGHLMDMNRQAALLRQENERLKQKVDELTQQFSYY
jgi:CRP-like cAMP-binding protein